MEVHHPEKPIRSPGEFLFHMLTVTLGILIALGLEALVEAHRSHELVDHARTDFRAEFSQNRAKLNADEPQLRGLRERLEQVMVFAAAKLAHKQATPPSGGSHFISVVTLPSTAWQTAAATQALLHMPFAEARAVSVAYSRQTSFNQLEDRVMQQWFEVAAFDGSDLPDQEARTALQRVKVLHALITTAYGFERSLIGDYDKALAAMPKEGR